jgi:hypothetical protein
MLHAFLAWGFFLPPVPVCDSNPSRDRQEL